MSTVTYRQHLTDVFKMQKIHGRCQKSIQLAQKPMKGLYLRLCICICIGESGYTHTNIRCHIEGNHNGTLMSIHNLFVIDLFMSRCIILYDAQQSEVLP